MSLFSKKRKQRTPEPQYVSPIYTGGHANPLFDPSAVQQQDQTPVLNAFAQLADDKQRTTGKGHGKSVMKDRHIGVEGGGHVSESANQVGSKTYARNIGDSGTNVGYFKPDQDNVLSNEAYDAGIAADDNDQHFAARAVASSRLDKELGIGVLSHDHFAKHGGVHGLVSAQVQGEAMMENIYRTLEDDEAATWLEHLQRGDLSIADVENRGLKVDLDEDGEVTSLRTLEETIYNQEVDLTNPETLRGLADLQFMDYLTGQVDRHAGNIHVDADTGQVTGIDNDLAFGTRNGELDQGKNFMGLPQHVDRRTANRFLDMDERAFLKTIGGSKGDYGRLSDDELGAAMDRYHQLRDHVEALATVDEDGRDSLVDIWDEDILAESIAPLLEGGDWADLDDFELGERTTSYIGRAAWDLK